MKVILLFLMASLALSLLGAEGIEGDWNGILDVQVMQLKLVFHITASPDSLAATWDSPDQSAFGLPVTAISFENSVLSLESAPSRISYSGELKDGVITGTFKQAGQEFPLVLTREEVKKVAPKRPQEPSEPYPYSTEEVFFANPEAGIKLAGTLCLPDGKGPWPAVVLISGSGAQDRDEKVFEHRPFLIIADHLARNGIASLRYDDRGMGASEGDFASSTTFDFATDAASAAAYLKSRPEINRIGLAGHSEGGIIAPIVASAHPEIDFIILLAGTGVRGDQLLLMQQAAIMRVSGSSQEEIKETLDINGEAFAMVIRSGDPDSLRVELEAFIREEMEDPEFEVPSGLSREEFLSLQLDSITNPWMYNFIRLDPTPYLEKVKCPVLALNGMLDLQVPYQANLGGIREALARGGNKNVTIREFAGLNHLFQECETGNPDEYGKIEQTLSPQALEEMAAWIKGIAKLK